MERPKVSVIIPVYKVVDFISRCARSLFSQSLRDVEYIFINDCTPDNSIEILQETLVDYPAVKNYVKIYSMPENSGQSAVRRYGISVATGEYIIFCDSDDWVDVDYCKKLWEKAVAEDLDIVICDYYKSDGKVHTPFKSSDIRFIQTSKLYSELIKGHLSTAVWNKLVKRSLYQDERLIFPKCNMWEDFVLNTQTFYAAKKIGYIPQPLYYYYYNPNSICNSNIENRMNQIEVNSRMIIDFINSHNIFELTDTEVIQFKYYSRMELSMYVNIRKYRERWRTFYPEINSLFLKTHDIPIREKLKFISLYIGIYPIVIKMRKLFMEKLF